MGTVLVSQLFRAYSDWTVLFSQGDDENRPHYSCDVFVGLS
jgi:hypothetical protein